MDLHDLNDVLTAAGPFVTVHVESESAVEQAAAKYDMTWKDVAAPAGGPGRRRARRATRCTRPAASTPRARPAWSSRRRPTPPCAWPCRSAAPPPARSSTSLPLPHLLPLIDDVTTRIPHVVVLADHTGADVSAYYDTEHVAKEITVKGHAPDIRKVPVGGWSHLQLPAPRGERLGRQRPRGRRRGGRPRAAGRRAARRRGGRGAPAGARRGAPAQPPQGPVRRRPGRPRPGRQRGAGAPAGVRRGLAARRHPYAGAARGLRAGAGSAQARRRRPRRRRRGAAQGAGGDAARRHRRAGLLHPVLRPRAHPARHLGRGPVRARCRRPPGGPHDRRPHPRCARHRRRRAARPARAGHRPAGRRRRRPALRRQHSRRRRTRAREHDAARLARHAVPARRHVRRHRHQLRALLRGRHPGRALPVRGRRHRDPRPAARARRLRLARLPAAHRAGPALRLPRARPVRARARPPVQPEQAAARPVREGDRGRHRLVAGLLLLHLGRRGLLQRRGLRAVHEQVGRHQPVLRLGQRPPPAHAVQRDGHLRGARQGAHQDPPGHPGGHPGHVRRPVPPGDDRALPASTGSPPSSSCRCTSSCTTATSPTAG